MSNTPLPANDRRVLAYPAPGTSVITFDFPISDAESIRIRRVRNGRVADLALGTDFDLPSEASGPGGGSVRLFVPSVTGDIYAIDGISRAERMSDFLGGGGFSASKLNADLDYLTQLCQELRRDVDASLPLTPGSPPSQPLPRLQPGRLLIANAAGDGFENGPNASDIAAAQANGEIAAAGAMEAKQAVAVVNFRVAQSRTTATALTVPADILTVQTNGYATGGDRGGGLYRRASTEPVHAGKFITADGAWWELTGGETDVRQLGAIGDGAADDRAALASVEAMPGAASHLLSSGVYRIGADLTLTKDVRMRPGALIRVPNGVTLTIVGNFDAPCRRVFICEGSGRVVFSPTSIVIGHPEWWGAVANSPGTDCLAAINACIKAVPITLLRAADYWVSSTVLMQTAHRLLRGAGKSWTAAGGTRLIVNSATANALLMGLNVNPGAINSHLQHVYAEDLTITRSPVIDSTASAYGVNMQWTLFAGLRNVEVIEHKIGVYLAGCVQAKMKDCYAFRSGVGSSPTNDSFYGYFLNGSSGLAAAGGNASVYFDDCTAACGLTAAQCPTNVGYGLAGQSADTFIRRGEVTSCLKGIVVSGGGTYPGNADIHIQDCVCDAIAEHGILFSNLEPSAVVKHTGNYYAPAAGSGTFVGIGVLTCNGMIASHNNQVIGWPKSTTGIQVTNSSGFASKDDMLLDCAMPVALSGASTCSIEAIIKNNVASSQAGGVSASGSTNRCKITPIISGGGNRLSYGVDLDASCSLNHIDPTMIVPATVSGNKVRIAGTLATSPGTYGTNVVSGVAS